MAKCLNCARETERTADWMCRWCGYPLLSGPYKTLDQTYRELKGDLAQPIRETPAQQREAFAPAPPKAAQEITPSPKAAAPPPPPPSPLPEAIKPKAPTAEPARPAQAAATPPPPPRAPIIEPQATQAKLPPIVAPAQPPPPVQTAQIPALEISMAELLSAYETDGVAADARYANAAMKLTGVIERVNIQAPLNVYFIILSSQEKSALLQGGRCIFDASQAEELGKLVVGQTITVQGTYSGSMIDISLRNCTIIKI